MGHWPVVIVFKCFNLDDETNSNYILVIIQFGDPFLSTVSTNIDSCYVKFVKYNLPLPHHCHVLNF